MSNSIPAVGIGNPAPAAAATAPSVSTPEGGPAKAADPTAAPPTDARPAATLDLSPSAGISSDQHSPPLTMEEAAQAYQAYINNLPANLVFEPNSEAGMVVFKVVNPVTQKVIRQLPPEDVVQQAVALRNSLRKEHSGILFDEQT